MPDFTFSAGRTLLATLLPLAALAAPPAVLPSFSAPSVSPDRQEIAFVSGGDVWTVPKDPAR